MENIKMAQKTKFRFNIVGTDYKIAVNSFKATEILSEAFEVTLDLVSKDQIDFNEVIERKPWLPLPVTMKTVISMG